MVQGCCRCIQVNGDIGESKDIDADIFLEFVSCSLKTERAKEVRLMELLAIRCANCKKEIFVQERYIRERMFCTLDCMDNYNGEKPDSRILN
jgi:hypothetical protein